jgi:hypothetical protein
MLERDTKLKRLERVKRSLKQEWNAFRGKITRMNTEKMAVAKD